MLACNDQPLRGKIEAFCGEAASFNVIGCARDAAATLAMAALEQPDIILLDGDLSGRAGASLMPALCGAVMHGRVVLLLNFSDPESERRGLMSGASGVLAGNFSPDEFVMCIESVFSGSRWLSGKTVAGLIGGTAAQAPVRKCGCNPERSL